MADDTTGDAGGSKRVADLAQLSEHLDPPGVRNIESAFQKAMASFGQSYPDLQERMKALTGIAGADSALGGLADQIAKQQRTLEAMQPTSLTEGILNRLTKDTISHSSIPRISDIHTQLPPNPILETNKRLGRIEDRFEQMQDIATDAAKIATGLQAAAAEFLFKFEKAVSDNDISTRRAFRISTFISVAAIIIAIATTFIQALYEQPDSTPALQAAVEEMQAELAALREAQDAASSRLTDALAASDQDTASVLRDIRDLLSTLPAPAPVEP